MDELDENGTIRTNFATRLERSCSLFETLLAYLRFDIKLVDAQGSLDRSRYGHVRDSLAQHFLFEVNRARRICERGAGALRLDRAERRLFMAATAPLVPVRNINEHGRDVNADPKPSFHGFEGGFLTEDSMVIMGAENIRMGPIRLNDIYDAVDRMRKIAGWSSLDDLDPEPLKSMKAAMRERQKQEAVPESQCGTGNVEN